MRPKLTSAVRRGLASLAARAGQPITTDEVKGAAYAAAMGSVKVLRPNAVGGRVKRKRKGRVPKGLR